MSDYNKGTDRAAVIVQRRGLPHVKAKLAGEAQVTVAFLGGSITEGAGASAADKTSLHLMDIIRMMRGMRSTPVFCEEV